MVQLLMPRKQQDQVYKDSSKKKQVRSTNIVAAKAVVDAIRTSLGPRGMDKMIEKANGEVLVSNDGATILKEMEVVHPAAKMLVGLADAQDVEAGDGTTTVVVLAGQLLDTAGKLLEKGLHPTVIADGFLEAAKLAPDMLLSMSKPIDLNDTDLLTKIATTSLSSKVVSQYSHVLGPIVVNAVRKVSNFAKDADIDLKNIRLIKKLGGTVDDSELIDGAVLDTRSVGAPGAPRRVEKARIGLIQFQLSPPKTDVQSEVIISNYSQMDRGIREEREYLLNICKQISKANCNVLLIQKSILRDAVTDLSLHYLAKMKIMVIKDIEREDIEFVSKILNCRPIASLDHFTPQALGYADVVEDVRFESGERVVKFSGVQNPGKAVSILLRGSNRLVLDEAERSMHDAICVLRCLFKKRFLICGGGAPEMELACRLRQEALRNPGIRAYCYQAFADALEIIPYTLAENAGLNPIATITELRNKHASKDSAAGINVRKGRITNMYEENVIQPALVTISAVTLASEAVKSILKIDDIVSAVRD
uniref:T-complex protein 1 subunit delta n=1 Tax=Trichuris muris TaxID=70415 RepID=A0A5S6QWW6_TRIMR